MTDTIEAVARVLATMLEGGREYDQMPATRRELKIWNRAGMCSINDATKEDAREAAEQAIAAHTKALIEGAGEVERKLMVGDLCSVELAPKAAATIAALRTEVDRAKLDGVRAGIAASAKHCGSTAAYEPHNECCADSLYAASLAIRALDAEAIAKGEG